MTLTSVQMKIVQLLLWPEWFMSDDDKDSSYSSPSGTEDSWVEVFDFFFCLTMNKISGEIRVNLL